ncbi:MAG: ATP-binding protein [Anaerolineales bacterium]
MNNNSPPPSRSPGRIGRVVHSFRFRLTLLFVAILALILAGFSAFIYTRQAQIIHTEMANRLAAQSAQLVTYYSAQLHFYEEDREGRSNPIPQADLPLLPENAVLALIGTDGNVILQQGTLQPDILRALLKTWNESSNAMQPLSFSLPAQEPPGSSGAGQYLFQISPMRVEEGWAGYILLASPVETDDQLARLAVSLGLGSLIILVFAFLGGYWLADRAMKPVQTIVHTAQQISESDLSRRLNLDRDDELGELADTFDQMLDRLQAAFERQRQFTADASHELRSPLTIIELEANRALERRRTTREYEQVLRLIQSENEWMGSLVNELLLLARMDAGQIAMRSEILDLSDVVLEVIERLGPIASARGVMLKTANLEESYVQADRVYVAQLLTNLVENALKYSQGEGALVMVESANQVLGDKKWSLVRITDNGPGIPEEQLPYIFDRFYRLDEARTRQMDDINDAPVSGSGLGLAISKSIAEIYGGKIEVQSQAGQGTIFTVWLPGV